MGVNAVLTRNIDGLGLRLWEHVCGISVSYVVFKTVVQNICRSCKEQKPLFEPSMRPWITRQFSRFGFDYEEIAILQQGGYLLICMAACEEIFSPENGTILPVQLS